MEFLLVLAVAGIIYFIFSVSQKHEFKNKNPKSQKYINEFTDLETCRVHIIKSVNDMALHFFNRSKDFGDIWFLLHVDFSINMNAMKFKPDDIPVIVTALMCSINLLGDVADSHKEIEFLELQEALGIGTFAASSKLIEIYGRKINDSEVNDAIEFIQTIKWNSEKKMFLSSTPIKNASEKL